MKYRISRIANADIESICDYIAVDSLEAAARLNDAIHRAIQMLSEFPGMGHRRNDVSNPEYRFWTVSRYVIAYKRIRSQLVIMRVLDGARDIRELLDQD